MVLQAPGTSAARPVLGEEELRRRYGAYRRRQAAQLVRMLPGDAVRPLYRRAAERVRASGADVGQDPLALLVAYCEELLPLPPFERWREDLEANPAAHLAEVAAATAGPTADAPSTLDVRPLEYRGRRWRAHLRSFRDGEVWRGFIAFEDGERREVHRTGAVFCEAGPMELRRRFGEFDVRALEAFLRSSIP